MIGTEFITKAMGEHTEQEKKKLNKNAWRDRRRTRKKSAITKVKVEYF